MTDKTTYEEFIELSKNPPVWEGETLYKLSVVSINRDRRRYPRYDVGTYTQGFFHTREEAEQVMRQNKEGKSEQGDKIYCYYLQECPYSQMYHVYDFVTCRVYDAGGQLIEQSLCSKMDHLDVDSNEFFGRTENKLRFKEGDIVEVLGKDKVWLSVVISTPPSPEQVWTIHNNYIQMLLRRDLEMGGKEEDFSFDGRREGLFFEAMDDSYTVIDGPSAACHHHIEAIHIFAPHFTIPAKICQRFEKYYNEYLKECEEYNEYKRKKNK